MANHSKKESISLTIQDLKVKFPEAYDAHVACKLLDDEDCDDANKYNPSEDHTQFFLQPKNAGDPKLLPPLHGYAGFMLVSVDDRGYYYWDGSDWA